MTATAFTYQYLQGGNLLSLIDIKSLDLDELTTLVTENGFENSEQSKYINGLTKMSLLLMKCLMFLRKSRILKRSCYISVANIEKTNFKV